MIVKKTQTDNWSATYIENTYSRHKRWRPKGFWADVITLFQYKSIEEPRWEEPELTWSSGGRTKELTAVEAAEMFCLAMKDAIETARTWEAETIPEMHH